MLGQLSGFYTTLEIPILSRIWMRPILDLKLEKKYIHSVFAQVLRKTDLNKQCRPRSDAAFFNFQGQ